MPSDNTLVNIALKLDNSTDIVCVEITGDKFLGLLHTPLKVENIKNSNLASMSEQIRYELVKLFA